jgi:hypothetical protein
MGFELIDSGRGRGSFGQLRALAARAFGEAQPSSLANTSNVQGEGS